MTLSLNCKDAGEKKYDPNKGIIILDSDSTKTRKSLEKLARDLIIDVKVILRLK
jgi:hypothetical protein